MGLEILLKRFFNYGLTKTATNISIANMAGDGTNSAFALSLSFCFGGRNTIGLQFLYLAFGTGIKL
jgi:hypothetical protein